MAELHHLAELTTDLVGSYVAENRVPAAKLSVLIATLHDALSRFHHPTAPLPMIGVQMPGEMDGFALAREVARSMPSVAIIVCLGYL